MRERIKIGTKISVPHFTYREYVKKCDNCNTEYVTYHNRARFCSERCSYENRRRLNRNIVPTEEDRNRIHSNAKRSRDGQSKERKKEIYTRKNNAKSSRIKILKYGTSDPIIISQMITERSKERLKRYNKESWKLPKNKIKTSLYTRLRLSIKGSRKDFGMEEYLGCSFDYFRQYIEGLFEHGMSWGNNTVHGWHIDHIIPCRAFDLSMESERFICFNYKNMRPLWAVDNLRKNGKIPGYGYSPVVPSSD